MVKMTEKTCEQFLTALSTKAPVPGGGGASALVGAIGVALGNMVGSLTTGKKKYAAVEEDIQRMNRRAERLRSELEALVTADAEAFEPLSRAYGLPKNTPEEADYKRRVMESALCAACDVPMEIMSACCEGIRLVEDYARKGSVMAVSDAGCAAVLCKAALQAASLNVFINTKSMTNREHAQELNEKARKMLVEFCPRADLVFETVRQQLGG